MGQSDKVMKEESGQIPGATKDSLQKKGGLGAAPACRCTKPSVFPG